MSTVMFIRGKMIGFGAKTVSELAFDFAVVWTWIVGLVLSGMEKHLEAIHAQRAIPETNRFRQSNLIDLLNGPKTKPRKIMCNSLASSISIHTLNEFCTLIHIPVLPLL